MGKRWIFKTSDGDVLDVILGIRMEKNILVCYIGCRKQRDKPEVVGMNMKAIIKRKIEELLSKEFYCSSEELNGKSIVYSVNFDAKQPYIKILTYRNCVVVCTSEDLHYKVRELLQSKNRDEIFEFPLVYGQTIHYVPNDNYTADVLISLDYECEYLFDRDILSLAGLTGFENSLAFDKNGSTSTKAVYIARDNNKIIGVAGAAGSSTDGVWEIGIDVMEEYRNIVAQLSRQKFNLFIMN